MSKEKIKDKSSAFAGLEELAGLNDDNDSQENNNSSEEDNNVSSDQNDNDGINNSETTPPEGGEGSTKEQTQTEINDEIRSKVLNEMFGDRFESIDKFKESDVVGQLEELSSLREAKEKLESQLNQNYNPFANESVAKFNHFVKETGIDNMNVFSKISSLGDDSDPIDVLVAKKIVDNPKLVGRESDLKDLLMSEYKIDPDEYEEDEVRRNRLKLELDSEEALKGIGELKTKLDNFEFADPSKVSEKRAEELKEQRSKMKEQWGTLVGKISENIPSFKVDLGEDKGSFEFSYNQDQRKSVEDSVLNYLVENNKPFTQDSVKEAIAFASNSLYAKNMNEIFSSFREKVESETRERFDKEYSNPSALNNGKQQQGRKSGDKSDEDKAFDFAIGNL